MGMVMRTRKSKRLLKNELRMMIMKLANTIEEFVNLLNEKGVEYYVEHRRGSYLHIPVIKGTRVKITYYDKGWRVLNIDLGDLLSKVLYAGGDE